VQPLRRYAGVSAPVSDRKLMPVAITAGDDDLRNGFPARGERLSGLEE